MSEQQQEEYQDEQQTEYQSEDSEGVTIRLKHVVSSESVYVQEINEFDGWGVSAIAATKEDEALGGSRSLGTIFIHGIGDAPLALSHELALIIKSQIEAALSAIIRESQRLYIYEQAVEGQISIKATLGPREQDKPLGVITIDGLGGKTLALPLRLALAIKHEIENASAAIVREWKAMACNELTAGQQRQKPRALLALDDSPPSREKKAFIF